ncbi:MAG TPA: hypothetical protein VI873_04895 [Candidatus Peribacteraceae bacterium]|nr:hypothetical protein [Candidatus Peribacteraceae bacterium]
MLTIYPDGYQHPPFQTEFEKREQAERDLKMNATMAAAMDGQRKMRATEARRLFQGDDRSSQMVTIDLSVP